MSRDAPNPIIPCGELIERDPPMCKLDRLVPEDCRGCPHYTPGLNAQERARCSTWAAIRRFLGHG